MKNAGIQVGEAIIPWLVFYEQDSFQISRRTPDGEPGGRGLVLHGPSCHQGLTEGTVWVFSVCLSTMPLPYF